ncbi:LemA family protein [Candidatus Peregrinibacteria bacterium]|nr:LemA family protein [Candidatus Peregrinibacteria bacterium]MBI3816218.1 LemA family protein [Candidatus Peregrinibacteria bacterium]
MRRPWLIILGFLALIVLWILTSYNGLITAKAGVDSAWAQVQTTYQRRFDLVPNLVSTVKGAAKFEQSTLLQVTQARTQWQRAGSDRGAQIAAAQGFEGALSRLLVTVEGYPQLQATQAFRDLMTQLEGTENRISVARRDYNDAVQSYNVRVLRAPTVFVARLFGFIPEKFFQSTTGSENAPSVNFVQ